MKASKYLGCLQPTESDKLRGADIIFYHETETGENVKILACHNGEVWHQWGADNDYLSNNVEHVEAWFRYSVGTDN